jgi:hypothetical protein
MPLFFSGNVEAVLEMFCRTMCPRSNEFSRTLERQDAAPAVGGVLKWKITLTIL